MRRFVQPAKVSRYQIRAQRWSLCQLAGHSRSATNSALAQSDTFADDQIDVATSSSAFPSAEATSALPQPPAIEPVVLQSLKTRGFVQFPVPRPTVKPTGPSEYKRRTTHDQLALFDACMATGNAKRSLVLLKHIRQSSDDETTLHALNRYLRFLSDEVEETQSMDKILKVFYTLNPTYGVQPGAIAHAILCKAALSLTDENDQVAHIKSTVNSWLNTGRDLGEVLSVSAVLSAEHAQSIFDLSGLDYRLIGTKYRQDLNIEQHPLQSVPEVIPTIQRGSGLRLVKQTLNTLTDPSLELKLEKSDFIDGNERLTFNFARQRLIEEDAIQAALLRWRLDHDDLKERGGLAYQKSLNALLWEWQEQMVPLINEEVSRIDLTDDGKHPLRRKRAPVETLPLDEREADYAVLQESLNRTGSLAARSDYGPFLKLLKPEKVAAVAILEVLRLLTTDSLDGLKTVSLAIRIGMAIENEHHSEILKRKATQELFQNTYKEAIQNHKLFSISVRQARANAIKKHDLALFTPDWTQNIRARLGALVLSFLMYAARIRHTVKDKAGVEHTQDLPAFVHSYQFHKGQKVGMIKTNESLMSRLSSEPLKENIYPRMLPMLVPPRPWYTWDSGGYLFSKTYAMRARNSPEQLQYLKAASERGLLSDVFMGLDVLGRTPWAINDRVFECALAAWNSGEAIADIPPSASKIDLPPRPAADADPAIKFQYTAAVRTASSLAKNFASLRSDINYKLEIARAYLHDTMYFPHSLDFRGRAYPVPPNLNHLGNDLCRGLLKFGTSRKLGPRGLRWLKIHLANQCGYDKASFEEREAFVDKNIDRVFEASDHPMDGTRWWLTSDKPWQCLATCIELTSALRSPDPEKFMSSMPVHQDGTCNGLQHYAALGGDLVGAKQVNLMPSDRPQDVYRGVADIVAAEVEREAEEGVSLAKTIRGFISRKLVKQTVMTNVYGVTWIGARKQIEGQLSDLPEFKGRDNFQLASYIVTKVFFAIQSLFTGAQNIQEWLRASANIIARSIHIDALVGNVEDPMTSVIWTSPLELPIVQPYRKEKRRQIFTNIQSLYLSDPSDAAEVNPRKQATAFPPNFIHSLDATHMLMSALVCDKQGISFAAVHDSYWTHAADTDTMNVVLRDAFIKLHSQDLMEELLAEFRQRYAKHFIPRHSVERNSPAYTLATKPEHISSGKVQRLPNNSKSLIITDVALARKVFKLSSLGTSRKFRNKETRALQDDTDSTPGVPIGESMFTPTNDPDKFVATKNENEDHEDNVEEQEQEVAEEEENDDGDGEIHDSDNAETKSKKTRGCTIWGPIDFPTLPERGEFDVKDLKTSKYFFS